MSIIFPEVFAVVPLLPIPAKKGEKTVLEQAVNLYRGEHLISEEVGDFVINTMPAHLKPLHDQNNPFIKIDKNGNKTLFLLWGHPKNEFDTNYLVSLTCPLMRDSQGLEMYKPSIMMRGPRANVMVVGGLSCCSALQTHWSQVFSDGRSPLDDARIPLSGLSSPDHGYWLKGKVHVPATEHGLHALHHMAMDMMSHHYPEESAFNHDCEDKEDYVTYAKEARRLTI
jgi:hypothetical protein